jgi:hypothetical protein
MSAGTLLSRLDGTRRTGQDRWIARCPAHDDRGPSLGVRELDDGRVLLHCFAGCNTYDVLKAAGITFSDLFPARALDGHSAKPERRPFPALDVLRCIAREVLIVGVAAMRLGEGHALTDDDRARVVLAAARIGAAVDLAEGA